MAGIVSMAHALELEVVAEGVETDAQLAELDRLRCDFAQGFLFSRPVPAERIASMRGVDRRQDRRRRVTATA